MKPTAERPIYFDNHATTAVDPRVAEAMQSVLHENYGNPESGHPYGWRAKMQMDQAAASVAKLIGAQASEIEFTSGATASIQRAILGTVDAANDGRAPRTPAHIITAATEHKATLEACEEARRRGHDITVLTVDPEGRLTIRQILEAVKPNTRLVSLMHANNEIGTLHPIASIGQALREKHPEIYFHVDSAQTAGKHEIDVNEMNIDLLSLSAHKFHGPKGIGALYIRNSKDRRVRLNTLSQGTPNSPGIVGLGAAADIARTELLPDQARMIEQRERILTALEKEFGALGKNTASGLALNGPRSERLCNNISLSIEGVEPDQLMLELKDIAYSSASACTGPLQSHVLKAIGQPTDDPFLTTARFGLSRLTTDKEVSFLVEKLIAGIHKARAISKAYEPKLKPVLNS